MLHSLLRSGTSVGAKGLGTFRRTIATQKESTYQFVDKIVIEAKGGKGGDGCVSFEGLSPGKKRPSGGGGGKGGSVFLVADKNVSSLNFPTIHFNAQDGRNGGSKSAIGRNGEHLYIRVPLGTIITEYQHEDPYSVQEFLKELQGDLFDAHEDDEETENNRSTKMKSIPMKPPAPIIQKKEVHLDRERDMALIAEGGQAGIGNAVLAGSKHQQHSLPATKIPGQAGQERSLLLELKTIADVGLVGYPNAGKSSLLRALSNATPKVAAYPFTTLHPNIGIVEYSDCEQLSVADIPGLIDGAHENRGLGHDFLKHIERTKLLLFVIDICNDEEDNNSKKASSISTSDPILQNIENLITELQLYNESMLEKPKLIFVNKLDMLSTTTAKELEKRQAVLQAYAKELNIPILFGSAMNGQGVGQLAMTLRTMVQEVAAKQKIMRQEEWIAEQQAKEEEQLAAAALSLKKKQYRSQRKAMALMKEQEEQQQKQREEEEEGELVSPDEIAKLLARLNGPSSSASSSSLKKKQATSGSNSNNEEEAQAVGATASEDTAGAVDEGEVEGGGIGRKRRVIRRR